MKTAPFPKTIAFFVVAAFTQSIGLAQTVVDADFSKSNFAALGWKAKGDWDVFQYPKEAAKNPGPVARFAANKPDGSLVKTFDEVKNPSKLNLSIDYGWGWGDVAQGADSVSSMLLDAKGDGYFFKIHRTKAKWAVQWAKVANGVPAKETTWAADEIDATRPSIRDGGGLSRLAITRETGGAWSIACKDWNKGAGAAVKFIDNTTTSFSQLVLLGTRNFDEQAFNKIVLEYRPAGKPGPTTAIPVSAFLNSIGVVSTFPDRGQPLPKTIQMIEFGGFRWVRGGIEGLTEKGPTTVQTYLDLHEKTGVRFSWGLVSGGADLKKLVETAKPLAKAGALLSFEGNNEPNNWGVTYEGVKGGGKAPSWMAVARLQRDLNNAVKGDPALKDYPVWSISEAGAEADNVGLQFLTVPKGAGTLMLEGTKFADFANVHNYIYHPNSAALADNKTWNASDPTSACKIDGLFGNHGSTWAKHFRGYSEADLLSLPRVTTETGSTIGGPITEEIQALNLLSMYLDQFKRGWSFTAVYLLRDRTDEGGNQSFGFFKRDYTPRKAAVYLHNLTTILADKGSIADPGQLEYSIPEQPATVHEMLLRKSDGAFELVVWNERIKGSDDVVVKLGGTYPTVTIYDPTVGTGPIQTMDKVDSVKLTVSDHPLIIAIRPK
jgi:hypothetical protein